MSSLCAAWLTISLAAGQVEPAAPEADAELDAKLLARWGEVYLKEAQQYEMFLGEGREMPLELQPKPVFRWAEPQARNLFNGVIYVWTYQGRPEVIGSIWAKGERDRPGKRTLCHTFHSLATGPLEAVRSVPGGGLPGGESSWTPTKAGVNPQLFPDAPAPAKTPALRLAQMRSLARELTVTQTTDGAEMKEVELRLLPQPIYRYQEDKRSAAGEDGTGDGAIFAYLRDWDPEILLLVESRETKDGPRWHYAPLRFCYLSARVKYKDREVWSYEKGGPMTDRTHYYLSIHGASFVDRELPE
jgi:hypothetical protein